LNLFRLAVIAVAGRRLASSHQLKMNGKLMCNVSWKENDMENTHCDYSSPIK
jgi:hypothetical protein